MTQQTDDTPVSFTPVAIVGGGPVGLMLALFLDRLGVRSTVFNTDTVVRPHPKGSTQNARTMEHYRTLGFAEAVRGVGLPPDHPTDVAYFTRYNGWELARLSMPSTAEVLRQRAEGPATDQVPEPLHRANQMYVEPILFMQATSRPGITLRFGRHVGMFSQDGTGVTFRASGPNGTEERWRAEYLVGCDGGRSSVRRALGIHYAGFETLKQAFFGGRMISSHVRAPTLYRDFLGNGRAFQYWSINPEQRIALVALNGVDEFLIWTPSDTDNPSPEAVAAVLCRCAGADLPVEVLGSHGWTAGVALHAERFGDGRVLLAGDAVHLFTPTGGFGMNTGVDDAANLAWKLAGAVQGWGGPGLVASYEAERKPIAVRNTAAARALARSVGSIPVPGTIEAPTVEGDCARAEVSAFLATFGEEFASLGVQLGARYDRSPIVVADGTPPPDDTFAYQPSGVPGGRAPHLWLDDRRGAGASLFDRFGPGFTLLQFGSEPGEAGLTNPELCDSGPLQAEAARRGLELTVLRVAHPDARALYGRTLSLVRPDGHIAWRGDRIPADPAALLDQVTGHAVAAALAMRAA